MFYISNDANNFFKNYFNKLLNYNLLLKVIDYWPRLFSTLYVLPISANKNFPHECQKLWVMRFMIKIYSEITFEIRTFSKSTKFVCLLLTFFYATKKISYFLYWNFDEKSWSVVFFHEWNEWKNPQFNFSSQNLRIERNFFKWDRKLTKIFP